MSKFNIIDWEAQISLVNTNSIIRRISESDLTAVLDQIMDNSKDTAVCPVKYGIRLWLELIIYSNCFSQEQEPIGQNPFVDHLRLRDVSPITIATFDYLCAQRPLLAVKGWYTSIRINDHIAKDNPDDTLLRHHYAVSYLDQIQPYLTQVSEIETATSLIMFISSHGFPQLVPYVQSSIRALVSTRQARLYVAMVMHEK